MKSIITTWEWSPESEAKRTIHCAHQIATGFFRANNFLIQPYIEGLTFNRRMSTANIVLMPDISYQTIPRFWQRCGRVNVSDLPLKVPADLLAKITHLLQPVLSDKIDTPRVKSLWDKHQEKIIAEIYHLIPDRAGAISQIVIWPTRFGTTCSFSIMQKPQVPIYIWLRIDQGISAIVEAILTSLTRLDIYRQLDGLWPESEIIVDWLMKFSPLAKIIADIDPRKDSALTMKAVRTKQHAKLLQQSEEFLTKIGAPAADKIFGLKDEIPTIRNQPAQNLSPREILILKLLIHCSPTPATMDDIADIIFSDKEKDFSLWAIAKTIQRLRDKLEQNGVSGSFIQTLRGQGYVLKN